MKWLLDLMFNTNKAKCDKHTVTGICEPKSIGSVNQGRESIFFHVVSCQVLLGVLFYLGVAHFQYRLFLILFTAGFQCIDMILKVFNVNIYDFNYYEWCFFVYVCVSCNSRW